MPEQLITLIETLQRRLSTGLQKRETRIQDAQRELDEQKDRYENHWGTN